MTIRFLYDGPSAILERRQLLGQSIALHHAKALKSHHIHQAWKDDGWTVQLGDSLLFDSAGLSTLVKALEGYQGAATQLEFSLTVDAMMWRDYYSLLPEDIASPLSIMLPVSASRGSTGSTRKELLRIPLPAALDTIGLPQCMGGSFALSVPQALLMPYHSDFDLLFANQIAVLSALHARTKKSPMAWLNGLWSSRKRPLRERIALSYQAIHPTANVHPTAVVEGAVIGEGAEIGAHCSVRYSVIAPGARLYDGAKVEFSVVGPQSTLMHDLVLFRCAVEEQVFLIHGPYQFSYFQRGSSAFATILMDYRPDQKPIQVKVGEEIRPYGGRFLGSVIGERAKLLGGCLLAPGRIVPPDTWLAADPDGIHTLQGDALDRATPLSPQATRRTHDIIHS